jgi:hypothetical protein
VRKSLVGNAQQGVHEPSGHGHERRAFGGVDDSLNPMTQVGLVKENIRNGYPNPRDDRVNGRDEKGTL